MLNANSIHDPTVALTRGASGCHGSFRSSTTNPAIETIRFKGHCMFFEAGGSSADDLILKYLR